MQIQAGWDINGGAFRYGFRVACEGGTLELDSGLPEPALRLFRGGDTGGEVVPVTEANAYQSELDDFVSCLESGRRLERLTPADARLALEVVREELRQIEENEASYAALME